MKKIAILGASAGVGLATVHEALLKNCIVKTLSRHIESIPANEHIERVQGNATQVEDIIKTIDGADAIIVCLGTGTKITWKQITKGTDLYSSSASALLQAVKKLNLAVPMLVVTGFGAGDSQKYQPFFTRIFMQILLGKIYSNKTEMEKMIVDGYPNWEIVRPGRLLDTPRSGKYNSYNSLNKGMKVAGIARADVAEYLISEVLHPQHLNEYITLTY